MKESLTNCNHDKVYDNQNLLTSFPPQRRWICRLCGEEGVDPVGGPPLTFANEYDVIKKKFKKESS